MDPFIGLFITAVGALWVLVHFGLGQRGAHAREQLWREAAAIAGVEKLDGSEHLLEGWSGTLRVQLSPFAHGEVRGTRITVGGLPAELAVVPEGFDSRMQGLRGVREIETRDQAFASLSLDQAESILRDALRTRRLETAGACLAVLGGRGGEEAIAMLARVLTVEQADLAAAAADALAETRDAAGERSLLAALDHEDADVRLAVARALGKVGTAAAVARLKQAEAADRGLRAAARQAIAEIHSRLAGAEPGQLSLAEGESGRLSIPDDREGRLSLPEPVATPDGRRG